MNIIDLLNKTRQDASQAYQSRVPKLTRQNIAEVGKIITDPKNLDLYNEFTKTLVQRIGLTIINHENYSNPLGRFKKGEMPLGGIVQIIDSEMQEAEGTYNPDGKNPLGRRILSNLETFSQKSRKDKYVISVSIDQLRQSFTTMDKLDDFVNKQFENVKNGMEYDEYLITRKLLNNQEMFINDVTLPYPSDEAKAKEMLIGFKDLASAFKEPSRLYNPLGLRKWTPLSNQVLILRDDVHNRIDVNALVGFYQLEKGNIPQTIQSVFGFDNSNVLGYIVDENYLNILDQLNAMKVQPNADGLFDNYFHHIWQLFYVNVFKNAVRILDSSVADTAVKSAVNYEDDNVQLIANKVTHNTVVYDLTQYAYKGDAVQVTIKYKDAENAKNVVVKYGSTTIATGGATTGQIASYDPTTKFTTEISM